MTRFALPLIALGLLAACNNDPTIAPAEKANIAAEGDVLQGSISDEMLPFDTITSTSPAAKIDPSLEEKRGGAAGGDVVEEAPSTRQTHTETDDAEPADSQVDTEAE